MAMSNRTKIGIVLAVGVLAGLSSALLSLLLLAVAGFEEPAVSVYQVA